MKNFLTVLGALTWVGIGWWFFFAPEPSPEEIAAREAEQNQRVCTDSQKAMLEARIRSHPVIEAGLRAPSTADFAGLREEGVSIRRVGDCQWQMVSFVDAQNAFGGTVRTRFQITMTGDPESGMFRTDSVSFLE
ncbi:hypothetical protein ACSSV4_001718 [Roseovarius sp. MBR-154]|jgi:hypothetical protein